MQTNIPATSSFDDDARNSDITDGLSAMWDRVGRAGRQYCDRARSLGFDPAVPFVSDGISAQELVNPRLTLTPEVIDQIDTLLQHVTLPMDDQFFAQNMTPKVRLNAVHNQFSLVHPVKKGGVKLLSPADAQLWPSPPQIFYGSPLEAKIFVILNNPGYDGRPAMRGPDSAVQHEAAARDRRAAWLRLADPESATRPELIPWLRSEFADGDIDYYRKLVFGNGKTDREFLASAPGIVETSATSVFYADAMPYQSFTVGEPYVARMAASLYRPDTTLPSAAMTFDLAAAWLMDAVDSGERHRILAVRSGSTTRSPVVEAIVRRLPEEYREPALNHIVRMFSQTRYLSFTAAYYRFTADGVQLRQSRVYPWGAEGHALQVLWTMYREESA